MSSLPSFPLSLPWIYTPDKIIDLRWTFAIVKNEKMSIPESAICNKIHVDVVPASPLVISWLFESVITFVPKLEYNYKRSCLWRPHEGQLVCRASGTVVDISVQPKRSDGVKLTWKRRQNWKRARTTVPIRNTPHKMSSKLIYILDEKGY